MRKEIKHIHEDLNATFIYVTHDQTEAMTLATSLVVMNEGVIQQLGTPFDVFMRPQNTFVAKFMGAHPINLLRSEIWCMSATRKTPTESRSFTSTTFSRRSCLIHCASSAGARKRRNTSCAMRLTPKLRTAGICGITPTCSVLP